MEEIFKDIKGYEGYYKISNLGRVKSLDRLVNTQWETQKPVKSRILKLHITQGYNRVELQKHHKSKQQLVHRLIAQTFISNPDNKPQVNHINGIKTDNRIHNLEWCTAKENIDHAWRTGLNHSGLQGRFGKNHPASKLVLQYTLDGNFITEYESVREASKNIRVDASCISRVCTNKRKTAGGFKWEYK